MWDFLPTEKRWDCVLPSVQRTTHDTCRPLAKDAEAIPPVKRRICDQEVAGSIPGQCDAVQRTTVGTLTFLATMRPFTELLRSLADSKAIVACHRCKSLASVLLPLQDKTATLALRQGDRVADIHKYGQVTAANLTAAGTTPSKTCLGASTKLDTQV